ncbi:MAG: fumarylacetoacetate hydrolase family protein [Deltaproteobacteria bacterium]
MRIVRFNYKSKENWGILGNGSIRLLKDAPFSKINVSQISVPLRKVKLLTPSIPSKVILAGLNYREHARELNMPLPDEPVIFLKPSTALIAHGEDIIYPSAVKQLDYEAELALVIKKEGRHIPENKADEYILGYTCLNDVTARDLQKKDVQWTRSKSFDTFCPVGPWVETELDPRDLRVSCYLNGKLKQDSSTADFIFPVYRLVSFISRIMTLLPGDIISTGTPPGVGPMHCSDTVEVEIEGIGRLKNRVAKKAR